MYDPPNNYPLVESEPADPSLEKTPWNGWWTLLWGVGCFLVFLTAQSFLLIGVTAIFGIGDERDWVEKVTAYSKDGDVLGLIAFFTILFVCPLCWFLGKMKPGWGGWEYLGTRSVPIWKYFAWVIGFMAMVFGLNFLVTHFGLAETPKSMIEMGQTTDYPILLILGVCLGAPLVEEFIFRGILFRGWVSSQVGLWGTIFLTSAIWAGIHLQYELALITLLFFMGLVLGIARHVTGNVWVPVVMHAVNNAFAVIHIFVS